MHKILFYSGNPGKTRELQEKLQTSEYTLISAKDKQITPALKKPEQHLLKTQLSKPEMAPIKQKCHVSQMTQG